MFCLGSCWLMRLLVGYGMERLYRGTKRSKLRGKDRKKVREMQEIKDEKGRRPEGRTRHGKGRKFLVGRGGEGNTRGEKQDRM